MVASLPLVLLKILRSLALLQAKERHIERPRIYVDDGKLGSNWFPAKCVNRLLDLNSVARDLFITHMEDLEVVVHTSVLDALVLQDLLVPVHLHAEVLPALLQCILQSATLNKFLTHNSFLNGISTRTTLGATSLSSAT